MELKSEAKNQFIKNRDLAVKMVNVFIVELITSGVMIKRGWIRPIGTNKFEVMLAIRQENYQGDQFEQYGISANQVSQWSVSADFQLSIRLVNDGDPINEEQLEAEGYHIKIQIRIATKDQE